jgi:two-component system, response regulator PdtaR
MSEGCRVTTADDPRRRLLVAEDEPSVTLALTSYFTARGWTVVAVATLSEGERQAAGAPFDLVILDLRLGEMLDGGLRLAQTIGARQPATPIILLSGFTSEGTSERAKALGIDLVLAKPVRLGALLTAAMDLVLTGRGQVVSAGGERDGGGSSR